ncbi:MAG: helicase C-terminal domain-containing protein [Candidatus Omnitrophota bacterium]
MSFCTDIFSENGPMARHLRGYEARPQQIQMVKAVEDAINGPAHLIIEAGTGVGKSLAYLVPFIHWAVSEGKRAVISTYTKALQNQLFVKDLPFLKQVMEMDFRYALCMGSENYACARKSGKAGGWAVFKKKEDRSQAERIAGWLLETETGLVTDMDFSPESHVWEYFSRESDLCAGRKCAFFGQCFYMKARRRQSEAHILVTNHSLLFSDIMAESRVLPEFQALVLDEAHTLEDIATDHFGKEVTTGLINRLIEEVSSLMSGVLLTEPGAMENAEEVSSCIKELKASRRVFFSEVEKKYGKEPMVAELERDLSFHTDMSRPLIAVAAALFSLCRRVNDDETGETLRAYSERFNKAAQALDFVFEHESEKYVYWVDVRKRKKNTVYDFRAAPVDIREEMKNRLFERVCPVILTSATLSSSGTAADFSFIEQRLGMEDPLELSLDSTYDYSKNVLMYLPEGVEDPNSRFEAYQKRVCEEIIKIYDIMGGRMFALFTSYKMLNETADMLLEGRPDIKLLKQGDMPRYVLLDVFKAKQDSILMGTTTFWQGVDVPGRSLECVIITKLPFDVPSDPVNAARIRGIKENGDNPFSRYQLPRAVIMFKQGFGRLIRGNNDRGVVAVLDGRIKTRYYGKEFLNALPECGITGEIREVRDFLSARGGTGGGKIL